ncbi:hypothetical protein FIBSPDRAFT_811191 [Athelia psychrophila]|uniref:ABM domain-containing protein n=1 Tax=Athelia psychrophila TaxID=1759441 RepID=A0A166VUZ3_9AGAM|nr:hypothetical protein FIBSPDRAFT_811191 [Fibularhizoctonia sp. CBS 109695]
MALPSTEIIIFPSTEAFRSDLSVLDKGLGPLSNIEGLLSSHAGVQMQDPSIGYMINNFETLDNFKQLIAGPQFPEVLAGLKLAIAGPPTIHNVAFPFDITGALAKPITELAVVTATTPEAKEAVKECFEALSIATNRLGSYNSVVDKEDIFVAICGWESVEVRLCYSLPAVRFSEIFIATGTSGDVG